MSEDTLLRRLAAVGRKLSDTGADTLAAAIVGAGSPEILRAKADTLPTLPQRRYAERLADEWATAPEVDALAVAVALRAARAAAAAERLAETVQLVWTGPKSPHVPVSRNDEALLELIGSAERSLLLVSYATYQVPQLVEKLAGAVDQGVKVDLVLEFHGSDADQQQTWDPIKGLGATLPDEVHIYEWPVDIRPQTDNGKVGYLHVKCAVADERQAFVSSANLTVYAMEMNMELGVVIRGGDVPKRIARHFRELIDAGTLRRVEA